MQIETSVLRPGLYLVATPIGSARDITLRALDILASADVIAAEDTRSMKHLLQLHGVALGDRPVLAYHDHNGPAMRPRLLQAIAEGKSVAYGSEAGTPMVADPGYQLVRAVAEAGHYVTAAPGPSAVLAALCVAGLPSDRFTFAGFAPTAKGARDSWLAGLATQQATLVVYESPKRLSALLEAMARAFGAERQIVICRELTKKFEEVLRGSITELQHTLQGRNLKGEVVVLVDRAPPAQADEATLQRALRDALSDLSVKDAATQVAADLGLPRRQVYQAALAMGRDSEA